MAAKRLQPSQAYMLLVGAIALIVVRLIETAVHDWQAIDYFIAAACLGTIILSILQLLKKK